jgi:hypothetical protein
VAGGERLAVGVYEDEEYHIYLLDASDHVSSLGTPAHDAAALSPIDRTTLGRPLLSARAEPDAPAQEYPTTPYEATMSLVGDGQVAAGLGIGSSSVAAGGGMSFTFSDMLNDRVLATALEIGPPVTGSFSVNDIAFSLGYLRQDSRWRWGFVGGQVPYITGWFEHRSAMEPNGDRLESYQQTIVRETRRSGSGILSYPFDRARRIELLGGVSQTSREQIFTSVTYSTATGEAHADSTEARALGDRVDLGTSAVALISDATVFGPTSPLQGQRYRLEVAPSFGTLDFASVLIDYRRYMMPVAFYTIAARILHYGRYGTGAEDARLNPIYINDPGLVRGYETIYYLSNDCAAQAGDVCRPDRKLLGSRVLVGNVELRFPLLRPFGTGYGMYGPLPVELALFGDTGLAWNRGEAPALTGGSQRGVGSVGLATRIAFGFAVAEFDVVRPFQRQGVGWTFGFNLMPAW